MWDYDEVGTHIMIDGVIAGQPRKLITHSARNGFFYTMERANGAMVSAKPYHGQDQLDQGDRPEDRQARSTMTRTRTSRLIPMLANQNPSQPTRQGVSDDRRRQQLLAVVL